MMADECSCRFVGWINRQRIMGPGMAHRVIMFLCSRVQGDTMDYLLLRLYFGILLQKVQPSSSKPSNEISPRWHCIVGM